MYHDEIMSVPARVLSQEDRSFYFEQGYVGRCCMELALPTICPYP